MLWATLHGLNDCCLGAVSVTVAVAITIAVTVTVPAAVTVTVAQTEKPRKKVYKILEGESAGKSRAGALIQNLHCIPFESVAF